MQSRATGTAIGVVVALTTTGLLIAIALLPRVKHEVPPAPRTQNRTLSVVEEAARDKLSQDVDNDGLQDWEETLWNTTSNNPDSDGDGTTDGDEVKAGRNPARKGPGDTLAPKTQIAAASAATGTNLTQTDRLGRELFAEYIARRQSGEPLTESETAGMLSSLVASLANQTTPPAYTITDIKVGIDDKNTLRQYGNALGAVDRRYGVGNKGEGSALTILMRFAANPEGGSLEELSAIIERTRAFVAEAIAIETPFSFAATHVDFINHLVAYADALEDIRTLEHDPLASLTGLQQIEALSKAMYRDSQKIARQFAKNSVTFTKNENGYVFTLLATLPQTLPKTTL